MAQTPDQLVSKLLETSDDAADVGRLISGLKPRGQSLDMQPDDADAVWFTHFDCWDDSDGDDSYEESWDWHDRKCRDLLDSLLKDATAITGDERFNALLAEWPDTDREHLFEKIENLFIQNGYDVYLSDTMCEVYPPDSVNICPECGDEIIEVRDPVKNSVSRVYLCGSKPVTESDEDAAADPKSYLNQLDKIYSYYDVHSTGGFGGAGFSMFMKSTDHPGASIDPAGFVYEDSDLWNLLVRKAAAEFGLTELEAHSVDYICNISENYYLDATKFDFTESVDDDSIDPRSYAAETFDLPSFLEREGFERETKKGFTKYWKKIGTMLYFDVDTNYGCKPNHANYQFVAASWSNTSVGAGLEETFSSLWGATDQPIEKVISAYRYACATAKKASASLGESMDNMSPEELKSYLLKVEVVPDVMDAGSENCRECKQLGAAPAGDRPWPGDNLCWDCYWHLRSTGDLTESNEDDDNVNVKDYVASTLSIKTFADQNGFDCDDLGQGPARYSKYLGKDYTFEIELNTPKRYVYVQPRYDVRVLKIEYFTNKAGMRDRHGVIDKWLIDLKANEVIAEYHSAVRLVKGLKENESSEDSDANPKSYLDQLPVKFDYNEVMQRIQMDCSYCMDDPKEKKLFMTWLKDNEDLFPDVGLALKVIVGNDSWCTDNTIDMTLFFERLGFPPENAECPRCAGTGEEPGAPIEDDGQIALCAECNGSGTRVIDCECDNTHQAHNTVCQWCYARGRRHWNDPAL